MRHFQHRIALSLPRTEPAPLEGDVQGRPYNRTTRIGKRVQLMQAWAGYLVKLAAVESIPLRLAA